MACGAVNACNGYKLFLTWGCMKKIASSIRLAGLLTLAMGAQAAMADPLPVYAPTYPSPNSACATNGNFVSCSTKVLDYLASKNYAGFQQRRQQEVLLHRRRQ